jgi:hypothetical protein
MRRKCWFSLLLVPPPLEKICWFLKVHKKRKYLPLFLRLSFEINFDFLHDRRVFVIKFTHATLYTRDSQISSSSVSAKENRCAHTLSLSLFSSSSELLDLVKALFFHEATTRELYIFESKEDSSITVSTSRVSSVSRRLNFVKRRVARARLFSLLYFSRVSLSRAIWSDHRSDRRLIDRSSSLLSSSSSSSKIERGRSSVFVFEIWTWLMRRRGGSSKKDTKAKKKRTASFLF